LEFGGFRESDEGRRHRSQTGNGLHGVTDAGTQRADALAAQAVAATVGVAGLAAAPAFGRRLRRHSNVEFRLQG